MVCCRPRRDEAVGQDGDQRAAGRARDAGVIPYAAAMDSARMQLTTANAIIEAALAASTRSRFRPMGVVVLDDSGHLVAAQRQDGASMFRIDVAIGKAWAAVGMGASSRSLGERAAANPNFFVTLASTAHGRFLPQTGAVLIKDEAGHILGAVGASGGTGDEDEEICIAGVEAVGLHAG